MKSFHLSILDYVILGLVLAFSASIGVYFRFTGGKQKTVQEYLLADGEMSAIPVAFSLMASFISAITILGVSSEVYTYGTQFLLINIAHILGTPIVCYVYLPVFYKLRVVSVYEYLEQRFGKATRLIASSAFLLQMILYMGIVVYAPAIALSAVTGLDKNVAVLSVGIVCTFYSTIGGMKAVLFTDVFQSLLMLSAVFCVILKGILQFGLGEIWNFAVEGDRIEFFNFSVDPTKRHTFFTQMIGGTFIFLSLYGVNQAQVQRLMSTKDLPTARRSVWWNLPILCLLSFSTGFAGLVIYAKYKDCDPILEKQIGSSDQLLPLFVADSFNDIPGVPGLFIAGILSGSLSTVSSAINSLAAVTYQDYFRPLILKFDTETNTKRTSLITKVLALVYGAICIAVAFLAENFTGVLQASLSIFGIMGGPLLGLFTCGMLIPFTYELTVIPGFITALVFTCWMGFSGPKPIPPKLPLGALCDSDVTGNITKFITNMNHDWSPTFQTSSDSFSAFDTTTGNETQVNYDKDQDEFLYLSRISYQWYPMIGFLITIIIASVLSMLFKRRDSSPPDPSLLANLCFSISKRCLVNK